LLASIIGDKFLKSKKVIDYWSGLFIFVTINKTQLRNPHGVFDRLPPLKHSTKEHEPK